jgi:cholinesterase
VIICFTWADLGSAYIKSSFPNAPDSVLQHITQVLYPTEIKTTGNTLQEYDPINSESLLVTGYNTSLGRQTLLTSETVINCLTYYVNKAFRGQTYAYIFSTPPALHGQELYYVFYNGQSTDVFFRPINITLAHIIQDYWINFAQLGSPNGAGLPHFAKWGDSSNVQGLSLAGVGPMQDTFDSDRCGWWQLGLYV